MTDRSDHTGGVLLACCPPITGPSRLYDGVGYSRVWGLITTGHVRDETLRSVRESRNPDSRREAAAEHSQRLMPSRLSRACSKSDIRATQTSGTVSPSRFPPHKVSDRRNRHAQASYRGCARDLAGRLSSLWQPRVGER